MIGIYKAVVIILSYKMVVLVDVFLLLMKLFLSFSFIVLLITYIYTSWTKNFWKKRGVPYEKPVPFFGNLQYAMRTSFWDFFYNLAEKYKCDYFGIFLTRTPVLVVQTPELAKRILVKDNDKFLDRYLYCGYSDPLGTLNLFCAKNPLWGEIRRDLSPMFTSARLRMLTELMNDNAQELVHRIERENKKTQKLDLKELFTMYTSDTVGYTVFGLRVSALSDNNSPLWFITNHMVRWTFWRGLEFTMIFFVPLLAKLFRYQFFSRPATDFIKRLFWSVVDERKKTNTLNSHKDLINLFLKIQDNNKYHTFSKEVIERMSDNLMMAQAAVFILGSIETSSSTLCYCLHELAYNPEIQDKLYNDIKQAYNKKNKEILQYDDLMTITYLTSCIQETLRKYPPVVYLERKCNADSYKIDEKVSIKKGQPVYINVAAIHFNETYYPSPKEWRPERFTGDSDNDNRHFTFIPFGEGPRFCIGKRYGMMQIRTALAQILLKYRIEKAPSSTYSISSDPYSVLLSPKGGPLLNFVPRN